MPASNELGDVLELLDLPKVQRLRSGNTSADDVIRLITASRRLRAEGLLLAARPNAQNGAVLVAVIETPAITFVMDGTWLNMARAPRIGEIEELFQRWDAMGLLDTARYCTTLVRETCNLAAEEALSVIVEEGKPAPLDLPRFLKLLSRHGIFDLKRFRAPTAAGPSTLSEMNGRH